MKKYIVAGLMLVLLNSCDDGDLVYEDLEFTTNTMTPCSNNQILYKVNADQVFLLSFADVNASFPDTLIGATPIIIPISASNPITYRRYDGTVNALTDICATIQPATPSVVDQWTATEGQLSITNSPTVSANTATGFEGGTKITAVDNVIRLNNVTFQTGNGTQAYSQFPEDGTAFGVYSEPFIMPAIPNPNAVLDYCDLNGEKIVLVRNTSNLFSVKLSSALLDPTILNQEKIGYVDGTNNDINFRSFPTGSLGTIGAIPAGCPGLYAALPLQEWKAVYGSEANMTGKIIVITTNNVSGFVTHNVHLLNVTLKLGSFEFLLATDYFLGEINLPN